MNTPDSAKKAIEQIFKVGVGFNAGLEKLVTSGIDPLVKIILPFTKVLGNKFNQKKIKAYINESFTSKTFSIAKNESQAIKITSIEQHIQKIADTSEQLLQKVFDIPEIAKNIDKLTQLAVDNAIVEKNKRFDELETFTERKKILSETDTPRDSKYSKFFNSILNFGKNDSSSNAISSSGPLDKLIKIFKDNTYLAGPASAILFGSMKKYPLLWIAGAAIDSINNAVAGYYKSEDLGTNKFNAALGYALGGRYEDYISNMISVGGSLAMLGGQVGFKIGGPQGAIAGAVIGGILGAVGGYFGGPTIAKKLQDVTEYLENLSIDLFEGMKITFGTVLQDIKNIFDDVSYTYEGFKLTGLKSQLKMRESMEKQAENSFVSRALLSLSDFVGTDSSDKIKNKIDELEKTHVSERNRREDIELLTDKTPGELEVEKLLMKYRSNARLRKSDRLRRKRRRYLEPEDSLKEDVERMSGRTFKFTDNNAIERIEPKSSGKLSAEAINKTVQISKKFNIPPEWLIAVMDYETGGSFSPQIKNPVSTATGLIQFTEQTANDLGTSTSQLREMSQLEQLDYVEKYLQQSKRGSIKSLEQLYLMILGGAGKQALGLEEVLYRVGSREYRDNKGFDKNNDGAITVQEAVSPIQNKLSSAMSTLYPDLSQSNISQNYEALNKSSGSNMQSVINAPIIKGGDTNTIIQGGGMSTSASSPITSTPYPTSIMRALQ